MNYFDRPEVEKLLAFLNDANITKAQLLTTFETNRKDIGETMALRIIAYLKENGGIKDIRELDTLEQFGEGTINLMLDVAGKDGFNSIISTEEDLIYPGDFEDELGIDPELYEVSTQSPVGAITILNDAIDEFKRIEDLNLVDDSSDIQQQFLGALDTINLKELTLFNENNNSDSKSIIYLTETLSTIIDTLEDLDQLPDQPIDSEVGSEMMKMLSFNQVPEIITNDLDLLANSNRPSKEEFKFILDALDKALRELWNKLTPAQRKFIEKNFLDVYSIIRRIKLFGFRESLTSALGITMRNLFLRLGQTPGLSRKIIGQFMKKLLAIIARISGGSASGPVINGLGPAATKFVLLAFWAYCWYQITKWLIGKKIPGKKETYLDFYSKIIYNVLYKKQITCNKLGEEIESKLKFILRLEGKRKGTRNAREKRANGATLIYEINLLLNLLLLALNKCKGTSSGLEIYYKSLLEKYAKRIDELIKQM